MKSKHTALTAFLVLLIESSLGVSAWSAQHSATGTVPVSIVVSVEARHVEDSPVLNREDVMVFEGRNRLQVTDWIPLQGDQSSLELFVIIDDASHTNLASQFEDMRRFMSAQPPTTAIAIGYIQNGTVRIVQNFTKNHSEAGKALRIPFGSGAGRSSPYLSITDAIEHWPASPARHAIVLISDGIDALQPGTMNSYLDEAVSKAQRTGTQVSAIYASGSRYSDHSLWRINQGQSNLSRLADETGGEAHFQGFETPIALTPFLDKIADRLKHQYRLTFLANADKKPTRQHVRLESEVPNAELTTADNVYVPAVN
jgi:hypothetical protein